MAITSDVKFSEIQTEYGGINPIGLGEYFRSGVNVPDHANTATIPTSGQIAASDFIGTDRDAPVSVSWSNLTNTNTVAFDAGFVSVTDQAVAVVSDGEGVSTLAWTFVSGDTAITINNAGNITNPIFDYNDNITNGDSSTKVAIWRVTATDAEANIITQDRTITLTITKTKEIVTISWPAGTASNTVDFGLANNVNLDRTVTVNGGRGPFTFLWEFVSGTSFTITNGTTATANFAHTAILSGPADTGVVFGTYKVTVTDTFDGEVDVFQVTNGVGLRLIENVFTGGPNVTVNNVLNSKTDAFGTVGNNVSVGASTSISHDAGYGIASFSWVRLVGSNFTDGGLTVQNPTWTFTNDIIGPADTGFVRETWELTVTDDQGFSTTDTGFVDLKLVENVGSPPTVNAGLNRSQNTITSFGSVNKTSVTAAATVTEGDHPTSTKLWTFVSGDSFVITNATSEDATFSNTLEIVGPATWSKVGIYRLTATDVEGQAVSDDVQITLSHEENITGSIKPTAFAGADKSASQAGAANSGSITVQDEITDATATAGSFALHALPLKWELVSSSNGGFTVDIPLGTFLANTVANRTPLFSRSENLAPGGSTSHTATYKLTVRDVQLQTDTDNIFLTLNISEDEDTTPDAFSFVDQTDVSLSSVIPSAGVVITGITTPVSVILTGTAGTKQMSINGGAFTSTGTISNGQTLVVRGISSSSISTSSTVIATIGGVSDTFSMTTQASFTFADTISSSQGLYDIRAKAIAGGWDGAIQLQATITINAGVIVTGSSGATSIGSFGSVGGTGFTYIGAFVATSTIVIQNNGTIRGGGGGGGAGGDSLGSGNGAGDGGDAIDVTTLGWTVNNNSGGLIQGGSGGGGGGGSRFTISPETDTGGGGGGGGFPNGGAGFGGFGPNGNGSNGIVGSTTAGGGGGAGGDGAGGGGAGGGVAALDGGTGNQSITGQTGGAKGVKGKAVDKNGNVVTIVNNGIITGATT